MKEYIMKMWEVYTMEQQSQNWNLVIMHELKGIMWNEVNQEQRNTYGMFLPVLIYFYLFILCLVIHLL